MEEIITDDGSKTFRSKELDEPYHTKAGAIVEALEKHSRALKVWEKKNPIIFDVCSGLSYSAACALEEIRNHGNDSLVTIYLYENDREILEKNLELDDVLRYEIDGRSGEVKSYHHIKNAIKRFLDDGCTKYVHNNLEIDIIFGDFRKTLEEIDVTADFIFYAPFSPMFTPDMWTQDIFALLYSHAAKGGKLSTYSYARKVRDALTSVGFTIQDGPILGRRSPSLIAIKN